MHQPEPESSFSSLLSQARRKGWTLSSILPSDDRPVVETAHVVEPDLAGCAHCVVAAIVHDDDSKNHHGNIGRIYLGPQQAAGALQGDALDDAGITGIVNCTTNFPNFFESRIEYCRVAVVDADCGANMLDHFAAATAFIERHVSQQGGSVLVHCQMGISRSATVVIAYLMRYRGMNRHDAYRHVRQRRPSISPNRGFWEQLQVYEARLGRSPQKDHQDATIFDKDWAEQSLAKYQYLGGLVGLTECFPEVTAEANASEILDVATDYVLGRGVKEGDLPWYRDLCRRLSQCNAETSSIISALFEDGSEFVDRWSGEVGPELVERIIKSIL